MAEFEARWWRELKTVANVELFEVDLAENAIVERRASRWLTHDEMARANRFVLPQPARRFLLCRAALRLILCNGIGCANIDLSFRENEHGKPTATVNGQPVPFSFNVSHSGDFGLIAVVPVIRIGVDLEQRRQRRDFDLLIQTAFSDDERAVLLNADACHRAGVFFDLWTVKEAVLKAIGSGFSGIDPREFEVPKAILHGAQSAVVRYSVTPDVSWRVETLGTRDYAAALAIELV